MGLRVGVAPALNSWPMAIRVLAVKYPDASLRLRDAVQGRGEGFMARDPIQLETLRRLVHEERLRAELTAEITAKLEKERAVATWPARLWTFFNSPLGVIVFSSVLIASVGKFYSDYRSEQIEINARRTEAMKLATEYDRRLNAVRSVALDVLEAKGRQVGGSPPTVRLPDEANQRHLERFGFRTHVKGIRGNRYNADSPETRSDRWRLRRTAGALRGASE
jgi:hypothetical protein